MTKLEEMIRKTKRLQKQCDELFRETRQYGYGDTFNSVLRSFDELQLFGYEYGEKVVIPRDFHLYNSCNISNSALKYKPVKDAWYIHWDNGNIGKYQFVRGQSNYNLIDDEWNEFKAKLMSYNPVDFDPLNDHIIYDIENGKKVMADYKDICKHTSEAVQKKIEKNRISELEKELKKLKGE